MKKMKKIAFMMVMILAVNLFGNITVMANSVDGYSQETENTEITVTSKTGEILLFYKEGNEYKIMHENGETEVWAVDTLISSEVENRTTARDASGWTYSHTDRYATNIDWERLDALLTVADAVAVLSAVYGIVVASTSVLFSIKPETVYRVDDTYIFDYDPLYWMVKCKIYRYSNYTGLLESFTKYYDWNNT